MMITKARQHGTLLSMTAMATILGGLSSYTQATTQMYYVHNDHLGTPIVMTDQSQTVVWEGNKNPFGEMVTAGSVGEHSRFPGQVFDAETGLHYNYFRDYDPSLGRYIQSDPIGLQAGLNSYSYANSNPILLTDPYGLRPILSKPWTREACEKQLTVLQLFGFGGQYLIARAAIAGLKAYDSLKYLAYGGALEVGIGGGLGLAISLCSDVPTREELEKADCENE